MMTRGVRKTPLAARLKAVYGSPDNMDAFVGIVAERHLPGSELGELQNAIVTKQFLALRDADRFFYGNDPALEMIKQQYGIDFRQNLGDTIAANTDIPRADMNDNVFLVKDEQIPAGTTCSVTYHVDSTWDHAQQVSVKITNLSRRRSTAGRSPGGSRPDRPSRSSGTARRPARAARWSPSATPVGTR